MKKDEIVYILSTNTLFKGLYLDRIECLLDLCNYNISVFEKNSIVLNENDPCANMGFILEGKVNSIKSDPDGSNTIVRSMTVGDFFGEALVFSSGQSCPSNIMTSGKTTILFISSESLLSLCEIDEIFLKNFLRSLSDKILLLNKKIKILSYASVRQKLSCFFIDLSNIQQTCDIVLDMTREELSQLLGVARPSISRELSKMVSSNLISVKGRNITLLNIEYMANLL